MITEKLPDSVEFYKQQFELAKVLGQQTKFEEVLRLVTQHSAQFYKADFALILMVNPDTRHTVVTMMKDGKITGQKEYRDIHIHVGGWIIQNQKSFASNQIQKDKRFIDGLFDKVPPIAIAGVPLFIEGIVIGALILLFHDFVKTDDPNLIISLENIAAVSVPFLRNTQKIREYFNSVIPQSSLLIKYNNIGLYGKSPSYLEMLLAIDAAAKCDARVLLVGETGTGKELVAKAIHKYSSRSSSPFIAIDCGAIPDKLLESEFFGHTRGAFTGAQSERQGLFQQANNGTLFLDEINNLPQDMQAKLLRVLQESEVRPVGSDKTIPVNVRVITASSVSLTKLVEESVFREDLFYRLHVYPIYIPDLKERPQDILLLANHFLSHFAKMQKKSVQSFNEEVIDFIKQRAWKGNIRELENFVERLVTLMPDEAELIRTELFPLDLREEWDTYFKNQQNKKPVESLKDQVQGFEKQIVRQTLIECNWNQSEAARRLDTSEKNIRYKMKQLGIRKIDTQ